MDKSSNSILNFSALTLAFTGVLLAAFAILCSVYFFYYEKDLSKKESGTEHTVTTAAPHSKQNTQAESPSAAVAPSNENSHSTTDNIDNSASAFGAEGTSSSTVIGKAMDPNSESTPSLTKNLQVSRETYYKKLNQSLISLQKAYEVKDSKTASTENSTISVKGEKLDYIDEMLAKCEAVKQNVAILEKNYNTATINKLVSENKPRYDFSFLTRVSAIENEFNKLKNER